MAEKVVFTKEEEARYWEAQRHAYIAKNDMMLDQPDYYWCDPLSFYRRIFPEGFLEERGCMIDWTEEGGGKPNAIAMEITNDEYTVKGKDGKDRTRPVVRRQTITDDLDGIAELVHRSNEENTHVFISPVSYFGKTRHAAGARFLHAFAVDVDDVGTEQLANLLKQARNSHIESKFNASLPQPSAIVNSGRGLHLYYVLDRPVPLIPRIVPFLQELKHHITNVVWNAYTSQIPTKKRQYQGIYQGFRMVGTPTRLNGEGRQSKVSGKYEAVAFTYDPGGEPWTVDLDYLVRYVPNIGADPAKNDLMKLMELYRTGGRTPLERARELWPDWYARRVENGLPAGRYTVSRKVYEWWLGRISGDATEATVGHRYWCVHMLAAYADKCGVPREELEEDAFSLLEKFDDMATNPSERFTENDILCALDAYDNGKAHRYTLDFIARKSAVPITRNVKRNGRRQEDHLRRARAVQQIDDPDGDWRNKNGAPTKCDLIREYAREHPGMSNRAIAEALGVSRNTVNKWLKPGWSVDYELRDKDTDGLPLGVWYEDGHLNAVGDDLLDMLYGEIGDGRR